MKKLLLIILATLIILTSCELTTKQNNTQRIKRILQVY